MYVSNIVTDSLIILKVLEGRKVILVAGTLYNF